MSIVSGDICLYYCNGVCKPHSGEQMVKEQLWAQAAPPSHACKACTSWRRSLKGMEEQLRRRQAGEGNRPLL